jgi:hypothetical protein
MKFKDYGFKYYTEKEIINPVFDDNPAKDSWEEMPDAIQDKLSKEIYLIEMLNDHLGYKMQINSTWRFHDMKGHAHREGAIDIQWLNDKKYGFKIFEFLKKEHNNINAKLLIKGFRCFWECNIDKETGKPKNNGWIHIDIDYDVKPNEYKLFIGYFDKKKNKMVYKTFENKAPYDYI